MSYHYVKIYYGPCESFYTLSHKPQKLRGLKDRLQKLGYRVDLAPVEFENYCVLEMCGHEVFRCNIINLSFNTPHEYDVVAQRAVEAVLQSSSKFQRARSYLWFWTLLEEDMFRSNEYGPKDYWPKSPSDLIPVTQCFDCSVCSKGVLRDEKVEGDKDEDKEQDGVAVIVADQVVDVPT